MLFLRCCVAPPAVECAEDDDLLLRLEVAYLYNFTSFIEWPEAPAVQPFVTGVIGDARMEEELRVLERGGKRAGGRRIEIRSYQTPDRIGPCEILFVGAAAGDRLATIGQHTAGKPTLLVADTPGFAGRGPRPSSCSANGTSSVRRSGCACASTPRP